MYSIVLAAFLTTGSEVPDLGRRRGGGCQGCYGGAFYSGCYGCWGGGYGGCYGGWGGCWGCGGGCWGCGGGIAYGGCCGGGGGMAGGGGGGGAGMAGGGGQGGGGAGMAGGGGGGGQGGVMQSLQEMKKSIDEVKAAQAKLRIEGLQMRAQELRLQGTEQRLNELRREINALRRGPGMPPPGGAPPGGRPTPLPPPKSNPRTGKVLLDIPTDALLVVNDKPIPVAASFTTPELTPGKQHVYTFEVVVVRNGLNISRVKQVSLRGGDVVRLTFAQMQSPDTVAVQRSARR